MNTIELFGNVLKKPEVFTYPTGVIGVNLLVEDQQTKSVFRCVARRSLAEHCKNLRMGDAVEIKGQVISKTRRVKNAYVENGDKKMPLYQRNYSVMVKEINGMA